MSNERSVLKWYLNRSEQASNTRALLDLCVVGVFNDQYKPSRSSQIILSENLVGSAMIVLINEYLNPFDESKDPNYLSNLSSGEPVSNDLANNILNIHNEGLMLAEDFIIERINSNEVSFHRTISRKKTITFSKTKQKVVIKNKNNVKLVEVNRNFLATLLCYNMKTGKTINFANALKYSLSPVPLSIGNGDGIKRKTNKSTLQKLI